MYHCHCNCVNTIYLEKSKMLLLIILADMPTAMDSGEASDTAHPRQLCAPNVKIQQGLGLLGEGGRGVGG